MVCITNPEESFVLETNSTSSKPNIHYFHYLVVDDIYELANVAADYCRYNKEYSIESGLWGKLSIMDMEGSRYYYENIKSKVPEKLIDFMKDTKRVLKSVKLDERFVNGLKNVWKYKQRCYSLRNEHEDGNTLTFSLISRQLMKDKSPFERCISYLRKLQKQDYNNIVVMLMDLYDCNFEYNIILVDKCFEGTIDNFGHNGKQKVLEFVAKAYDIVGLQIPARLLKQMEEQFPYKQFLHLTKDSSKDRDNVCSICIEPFQETHRVAELICCHKFHKECIYKWLENNLSCPCCREKFTKLS